MASNHVKLIRLGRRNLEEFFRLCLSSPKELWAPRFEGLPSDIQVESINANWERSTLDILISHHSFPAISYGEMPPMAEVGYVRFDRREEYELVKEREERGQQRMSTYLGSSPGYIPSYAPKEAPASEAARNEVYFKTKAADYFPLPLSRPLLSFSLNELDEEKKTLEEASRSMLKKTLAQYMERKMAAGGYIPVDWDWSMKVVDNSVVRLAKSPEDPAMSLPPPDDETNYWKLADPDDDIQPHVVGPAK